MLDFKELPQDGQAFEQLVREVLFSHGLHVAWSGRGADGGRDLICHERKSGLISTEEKTWLVQCKHFAHGGQSVGTGDLDDIVSSCAQHRAAGYLLACSTQPSSGVVQRLEMIAGDPANRLSTAIWDGVSIERLLDTPRQWAIAQRFFPNSAGGWRIYATERPNDFVAHHKGYVFHLSNRIGSNIQNRLSSIESRLSDIEAIDIPPNHMIRPRAVWYDDKNGGYKWYIDYMYPHGDRPAKSKSRLLYALEDGYVAEDGQIHYWDINFVSYLPSSDHYDRDHYGYYVRYLPNYIQGASRGEADWHERYATEQQLNKLRSDRIKDRNDQFDRMVAILANVPLLKIVRSANCFVEYVNKFSDRYSWSDIVKDIEINLENLFTASIFLQVSDEDSFHNMIACLPNDAEARFKLSRICNYIPGEGLRKSRLSKYELSLHVHPAFLTDQDTARKRFNMLFAAIGHSISEWLGRNNPEGAIEPSK